VWTGHGAIKIEHINKDDNFWKQKMENACFPKLLILDSQETYLLEQ
jgi:hypothetical protein